MAVSIAIRDIGPLSVAAGRIVLAALVLLCIVRIRGQTLPRFSAPDGAKIWLAALGLGFCSMALPFFLLSWGQQYVASGFAGVTMAAVPLLVLPLAHILVPGDQLTLPKGLGFAVGFAGVLVLIGLDVFKRLGTDLEPLARLACFGAAAGYAFGSIITRLAPKVDPVIFATTATVLAAFMILPIALIVEGVPKDPTFNSLVAVVFLGLIPTAAANLLLVSVIRSAGPTFMSLVNYQVPVWSVIFGALFLSEALPSNTIAALTLILAGVAVSQWYSLRRILARS